MPLNPFDEEVNPFDEETITTPKINQTERTLSKVKEISATPPWYDKLSASAKRAYAIFVKSAAKGFTGGNAPPEDLSQAYPEDYRKQFLKTEPYTPTEKVLSGSAELGYSLLPMNVAGSMLGWGAKGLSKLQMITRTAGVGAILGGMEKPEINPFDEDGAGTEVQGRIKGALRGAAGFGAFAAGGLGLQHVLSQYSQAQLKSVLEKARTHLAVIAPEMSKLNTMTAYEMLQQLTGQERNTVMNIMRGKWGMPQNKWKGWFEKNIGDPAYAKFIDVLEKIMPQSIKEKFVYRYAELKEYQKIAEDRLKNLHLWQDKAETMGVLVTDGISQAESKIILRAMARPTQMEILKTMNPGLYDRAFAARQILDEGSIALASIKTLPDKTRDTIIENLGSYVKRVYQVPPEKRGLFRFFTGRRTVREPRIYEKGKVARQMYEKPLLTEQNEITRELEYIDNIRHIDGVGGIARERLRRAGYGSIDRLAKADPYVIDDIIYGKREMPIKTKQITGKVSIPPKGKWIDSRLTGVSTIRPLIDKIQTTLKSKGVSVSVEDIANTLSWGHATDEIGSKKLVDIMGMAKDYDGIDIFGWMKKEMGYSDDAIKMINSVIGKELGGMPIEGATVEQLNKYINKVGKFSPTGGGGVKKVLSSSAWGETLEPLSYDIISQADSINRYKSRLVQRRNEIRNLIEKPKIKPDIPYEVRKKMGEIETAGYPVARSIQDIGYKVETARLFEEVATNPLFATSDRILAKDSGWVKMVDTPGMGSLAGMYVHPSIAKDINNIIKTVSDGDRIYGDILSACKMGKTTLNPATHGRNILSNTMLLEMSGVPAYRIPDLVSAAIDDIGKNTEIYQQLKKAGLGLGTFKSAEIEALRGVYSGKTGISEMLEKAGKGLDKTFLGNLNRLYQLEEEVFKIAKARHMLEQGFTAPNALAEGEKWLFNYNKIPEFIRQLRSHPFGAPFVTFQYKALPRILEALIKNPFKVLKYPLMLNAIEAYSIKKLGLSQEEVNLIKKDKPLTYILPFPDSNGNIRLFDMQYIVPYGDVFERRPMAGHEIPTFGFMQNPIFSTPYNIIVFNKDPYTGREIISENATEMKKAKQGMMYLAQQLLPPLTPGVGYSAENIFDAMEGKTDRYGLKSDYWWEVIGNIGGLKTKPVDMDIETYKRIKRTEAMWKDSDIKQSTLLQDHSLTSEERSRGFKELLEEKLRGFNKLWEGIYLDKNKVKTTNPFDEEPNPFD